MLIQKLYRFTQQVVVRGQTYHVGVKYALPVVRHEALHEPQRKIYPLNQQWAQRPFEGDLIVPILRFKDGEYLGESVRLEQDIWNQQLRRDLIHRLVLFTRNLYRRVTNPTLTLDRAAASGKKLRPQKGSGRSRQGQGQKPGWDKGVKAHGRKVRSLRLEMPKKVRLLGLKVALTASLYDRKVRIIDSEVVSSGKTRELLAQLKTLVGDDTVLIITGFKVDPSFERSSSNIQQVSICAPDRVNVIKLLSYKWILITKDGLEQMTQHIIDRTINCFTNERVPLAGVQEKQKVIIDVRLQLLDTYKPAPEKVVYDPSKPLDIKFKILRDYMSQYEKLQHEGKLDEFIKNMPKARKNKGLINSVDAQK